MIESCSVKMGLNAYLKQKERKKGVDQHHTAQYSQADLRRNLTLFVNFLLIEKAVCLMITLLLDKISHKPYDVTPCLPCCIVGLFGDNLDFNMNKIVIIREDYLKKRNSNILIYRPQISLSLSLSLSTRFPALSFLYVFHCLI